jgi:hypothetical protein
MIRFGWILLLALSLTIDAAAQTRQPPVIDDDDVSQAFHISSMPDGDPSQRLAQLLAGSDLDDGALFVLAGTHPGLVEQLLSDDYAQALAYLHAMPAPEVHRLRRGETVIRTEQILRGTELKRAVEFAEQFDFKRFKPSKLRAARVGPLEGRVIRVEVSVAKNRKSLLYGSVELAWPSTPERDEDSRDWLSRYFGARPSPGTTGAGSQLPLRAGSFEGLDLSGPSPWTLREGVSLGSSIPVGEIAIDRQEAVDGLSSLRFYADERTRRFLEVVQVVQIEEGTVVRARVLHRAKSLRVEFEQSSSDVQLQLVFLDEYGQPVGEPSRQPARLSTHTWEQIEVIATAPPGTRSVELSLRSAVSGRSWFDAVTLTRLN